MGRHTACPKGCDPCFETRPERRGACQDDGRRCSGHGCGWGRFGTRFRRRIEERSWVVLGHVARDVARDVQETWQEQPTREGTVEMARDTAAKRPGKQVRGRPKRDPKCRRRCRRRCCRKCGQTSGSIRTKRADRKTCREDKNPPVAGTGG